MIAKIITGIQATFLFLLLYIFAVAFLCLGQEYAGVKVIEYPVNQTRILRI